MPILLINDKIHNARGFDFDYWRLLILSSGWIIFIIVIVILVALIVLIYFLGKRTQKKQAEQKAQMEAVKQIVDVFVISKKRLRVKDAGLPTQVMDNVPKLMRRSKLPIIKVKIGPQIMNLICDANIYNSIPEKKELKVAISGIYVTEVIKGLHGAKLVTPEKKKGLWSQAMAKAKEKAGIKQVK